MSHLHPRGSPRHFPSLHGSQVFSSNVRVSQSPGHWPPFPPAFLRLEHLSLCTHPPRLSSHPPPPWGCPLRRLHSTDHPDTMMLTQSLARFVVHVILSHTIDCEPRKSQGCVQFTPNLPSTPHRSCHLRSSAFLPLKS